MKAQVIIFYLILISIFSCSIGKKEVVYDEMPIPPTVYISDNRFTVVTDNSIQNSALLIYKISCTIDSTRKDVYLKGYQALSKKMKHRFEIKVKGLSKSQLSKYNFYWIDSKKKRTKISIVE